MRLAKRGEPLGHILFDGPPGLGQDDVCHLHPARSGRELSDRQRRGAAAPKDLIPYLTNAEEGSVLFIDEIHRLPKAVEEFLYPAMEDFRIDIMLGEGVNARTINMPLRPFTLIGATTRAGMLSAPLRDRFQMREHLDFYTVAELAEIVRRSATKLQVEIDDDARRGDRQPQPRHAAPGQQPPALGSRLRHQQGRRPDHARAGAGRAWTCKGSTTLGLDGQDRKYLETIVRVFHGGPVGVEAVAHTMNTGDRHAGRRSRAVSAPRGTRDPHAARPQAHAGGLRSSRPHDAGRCI